MGAPNQYVREAENGALRIGQTRVSLDSVVYSFLDGLSAESIQENFPALSLAEAYGAIAYYLANRETVHNHLARQDERWEELRRKIDQTASPLSQRLRALKRRDGAVGG